MNPNNHLRQLISDYITKYNKSPLKMYRYIIPTDTILSADEWQYIKDHCLSIYGKGEQFYLLDEHMIEYIAAGLAIYPNKVKEMFQHDIADKMNENMEYIPQFHLSNTAPFVKQMKEDYKNVNKWLDNMECPYIEEFKELLPKEELLNSDIIV